jgi:hypothetical protein
MWKRRTFLVALGTKALDLTVSDSILVGADKVTQ